MKPDIDWRECLKDSPKFRISLEEGEQELDLFETKFEKIIHLCSCVIDSGKTFNAANNAFIVGLRDAVSHFNDDQLVTEVLDKFCQTLSDYQAYFNTMLDQCNTCFCQSLNSYIKNDLRRLKESRRRFQKHSEELESTLCRNASRSKLDSYEASTNQQTRTTFVRVSLEHMMEVNWLQKKKRIEVLSTTLSYIEAHISFNKYVSDLISHLEPFRYQLNAQLEDLEKKAISERKMMEETHGTLMRNLSGATAADCPVTSLTHSTDNTMEGYLFKRTSNKFKSWVRRWFVVENNQLLYYSRQQPRGHCSDSSNATVIEKDLRLCNIRPLVDAERRFCFQIISPTRCHILQADSEAECQAWITAIQDGASNAYRRRSGSAGYRTGGTNLFRPSSDNLSNTLSPDTRHHLNNSDIAQSIFGVIGNNICCDCGSDDPSWASINYGNTLCIECSGIHRSFGVHKSKVRSITLDAWEPEQVKVMLELGNTAVNQVYEAMVEHTTIQRATPDCNRLVRETWIKAKYLQRAFVICASSTVTLTTNHSQHAAVIISNVKTSASLVEQPETMLASCIKQGASQDSGLGNSTDAFIAANYKMCPTLPECTAIDPSILSVDKALCDAAVSGCLVDMLKFIALGANVNCQLPDDSFKSPLLKAIESGRMAAVEFLLLNGAKTDICDSEGRGPLHYAAQLGHSGHVCLLLKRNANQHLKDANGLDALSIAVGNRDANVVTLLRFARLNEEMKQTDSLYDMQEDDTFVAMFRDFTNFANSS